MSSLGSLAKLQHARYLGTESDMRTTIHPHPHPVLKTFSLFPVHLSPFPPHPHTSHSRLLIIPTIYTAEAQKQYIVPSSLGRLSYQISWSNAVYL